MDFSRLIGQFVNIFIRQIMNRAVRGGIDYAVRKGKRTEEMTSQEREQARSTKDMIGRTRKIERIIRRFR